MYVCRIMLLLTACTISVHKDGLEPSLMSVVLVWSSGATVSVHPGSGDLNLTQTYVFNFNSSHSPIWLGGVGGGRGVCVSCKNNLC